MHPDVCRFISDAVYDGRLQAEPKNANQRLILTRDAHPSLKPTGIKFLATEHDGCSQRSEIEAEVIRGLFQSLLGRRYVDRDGVEHAMGLSNILVVAPYNQQVNLLKRVLPEGARVGTVDKFQGQEAEAVLVSMTTSSGDYLPRDIEFLYSKNRLNVAISRARCLAVVVANPKLLDVDCKTPAQMALVNTLCWVRNYSENFERKENVMTSEFVKVPFHLEDDGSKTFFLPDCRKKRTGYEIGRYENKEKGIENYWDALEKVLKMTIPRFRRPNVKGIHGTVNCNFGDVEEVSRDFIEAERVKYGG